MNIYAYDRKAEYYFAYDTETIGANFIKSYFYICNKKMPSKALQKIKKGIALSDSFI